MDATIRAEINGHLSKADDKLETARVLLTAAKHDDAVSRAYYAVFHAASAVLLLDGVRVRTHGGLASQLGLLFFSTGRLDRRWARTVAALRGERENGDYALGSHFTVEAARDAIADAEGFVGDCRTLVRRELTPP